MTSEFISEFEITYNVYLDWVKHPIGRKAKRNKMKRLIWRFGGLLIAAFLILLGIFLPDNAALYIGIAFSGAMLYMLFIYPSSVANGQYKKALAENNGQPWVRTFEFADGIKMKDFRTQADYKYSQISQATEDNRYFYIWLGDDFVLRILKNSFTRGSVDAFRNFIQSKMKKPKKKKSR